MDWIKATADCSVENIWVTLREQIKSDFSHWEELKLAKRRRDVSLNRLEPQALMVTKECVDAESDWARVGVEGGAIVISQLGTSGLVDKLLLRPSFTRSEDCRLRYNEREMELWEVSRMFLERFLF